VPASVVVYTAVIVFKQVICVGKQYNQQADAVRLPLRPLVSGSPSASSSSSLAGVGLVTRIWEETNNQGFFCTVVFTPDAKW